MPGRLLLLLTYIFALLRSLGYDCRNKCVFSFFLNTDSDEADVMSCPSHVCYHAEFGRPMSNSTKTAEKLTWPLVFHLATSLKVIGTDIDRSAIWDFLLVIQSNHGPYLILFLPRVAVRMRGLCCRPLSVRLSVRHIRMETAKHIVKLLSWSCSPIVLVFFDPERRNPIPCILRPLQRDAKYTEVTKLFNLRLKSPFSSETARDRPTVAMER